MWPPSAVCAPVRRPAQPRGRAAWLALALGLGLPPAAGCRRTAPATTVVAQPAAANAPLPFVGAEALLREADALWRERDQLEALRGCIDRLERALVQRPGEAALASRLARAYFLLGYGHLRPQRALAPMKQAFERGLLAAEQALGESSAPFRTVMDGGGAIEDALDVVDAAGIDALTWYVGNLGGYAAAKGSTVALFYAERLRRGLDRLLVLDEAYHFATPLRFSAIFFARAPAFAGGSLKLARAQFERALALAPAYLDNAVAFAESYARAKRDQPLYASLLQSAAAADTAALGAQMVPELTLQRARARALLGQAPARAEPTEAPRAPDAASP